MANTWVPPTSRFIPQEGFPSGEGDILGIACDTYLDRSSAFREILERWSRSRSATVRLRERSRIVLMAAAGMTNVAIARELGTHTDKADRWRRRYAEEGIGGIERERPRGGNRGGRCPRAQAALRTEIIRRTTREKPPDATRWSCRSMAAAVGTTHSFVNTVWRSAG